MDELILKAARLAKRAHRDQRRKYHALPYVTHPARVAARTCLLDDASAVEVAAAWLHDVVEDTDLTDEQLRLESFPAECVEIVLELTNNSKKFPGLPRAERKQMDRQRLAKASRAAKRIKLIDRADNLRDLALADDQFKSLYAAESVLLARELAGTDVELEEELFAAIEALGFERDHQDPRTRLDT